MIYYVLSRWDANKDTLEKELEAKGYEWLESCNYRDLVKMVCDYQGTLLYMIPFDTYQPNESEYLMTYVGYGSCSGCDTLQYIQMCVNKDDLCINDFMTLCRDICSHIIRPYNTGWREDTIFNTVTEEKKND